MRSVLVILSAWFLFACPAQARDQFVSCVERQLAALGHDPAAAEGGARGDLASATRALMDDSTALPDMPAFSSRFAVTWCREIAEAFPAMAALTPGALPPVVLTDFPNQPSLRLQLQALPHQVIAWYKARLGTQLASRPAIVIARDARTATRLAREASDMLGVRPPAQGAIDAYCTPPVPHVRAFAAQHIVVVCMPDVARARQPQVRQVIARLKLAMAHEYFHVIQREFTADKVPRMFLTGTPEPEPYMRPSWLVEGTADFFAHRYMAETHAIAFPLPLVFRNAQPHRQTLAQVAENTSLSVTADYQVSLLAVRLLARRAGADALIAYWRAIGLGQDHDTAFADAFGQPRAAFEEEFEVLRTSLEAASAYGSPDAVLD